MNRDQIISFVYTDPEKRLERFCRNLTKSQPAGDWEELFSIVLEALCKLQHDNVVDLWHRKPGYNTQPLWMWLYRTAKVQAHGNRTRYKNTVITPAQIFTPTDDFSLIETDSLDEQDLTARQEYEDRLEQLHQRFEERAEHFPRLMKVVLQTYLKGGMNAAQVCREAGVPYNYYLAQIDKIRKVIEECADIRPSIPETKTEKPVYFKPNPTRCKNLIRISQTYTRQQDVPYWNLLKGAFQARERKLYPQPTLFPIRQYLPKIYRSIAIV